MKNINDITYAECAGIRGVLFDIDDTFTLSGKLIPEAFSALWKLHNHGLILAPITGRPAGWCDHIARMWLVDAVIGENGASITTMTGKSTSFSSAMFSARRPLH